MLPVSDVDRAKVFYTEKIGFKLDHDVQHGEMRVVQLTPTGSDCSIVIGKGMAELDAMMPGSIKGLHLVVDDIVAVRDLLVERGVAVGDVIDMDGIKFAGFADPDGNTWTFQQIPPERRG